MLPKNLKYTNKVESSMMSRSYTSNIQPNGSLGNYKKNSVCTIMIPTGPNLCLVSSESVLKFTLQTLGTGFGRFDSVGCCPIERIRVFHGSNLLEDIAGYNLAVKEYFDLQVSTDASYGKYSILNGNRQDTYGVNHYAPTIAGLGETNDTNANAQITSLKNAILSGSTNYCVNSGELIQAEKPQTYCITLLSILGSLSSSHYLPLFEMTASPIRLEIQFSQSPQCFGAFPDTITDFQVDNIEYIASYIALSNEALSIIKSAQSGPLSYTVQGLANFNTTAKIVGGSSNTQINFAIPAKYASIKSIIASVRDTQRGVNTPMYFPLSCSMFGLQQYYFKIGSHSSIPAIAPNSVAQYFTELLKAVGNISDLNHHPSIDLNSYKQMIPVENSPNAITNGSVNSGSFYIGLDCESFSGSDSSQIYKGLNTKNDDIFLCMNFQPGNKSGGTTPYPDVDSARFDAFVMFDQELVFQNGTAYVSF